MNILEKKDIDPDLYFFIESLKFDKTSKIKIVGSFGLRSQYNYSDVDMYSKITKKYKLEYIYNRFIQIISKIKTDPTTFFLEFKIQNDDDKIKIQPNEKLTYDTFKKYFSNDGFCKIDFIRFDDYHFTEMSIIYDFNKNIITKREILDGIKSEFPELIKEGKYYKLLKRYFSYYAITKKFKPLEQLTKIFNSDVGKMYSTYSRLESIDKIKKLYKDKRTKKLINIALNDAGYNNRTNIPKEMTKLFKHINLEGEKIYSAFGYKLKNIK